MNPKKYILIDTEKLSPIKSSSFSSAKNNIDYTHSSVQKILRESFGMILPSIVQTDEGLAYQAIDQNGVTHSINAQPAQNISDIPKSQLLKLLEGWIRIRRRNLDSSISNSIQSIFLNLRLPDPRKAIQQYLVENSTEKKRLYIMWGYESEDAPSVSIDKALSIFLDVPRDNLQSVLMTAMSPDMSTGHINFDTQMVRTIQATSNKESSKSGVYTKAALIALGAIGTGALTYFGLKSTEDEKATTSVGIENNSPSALFNSDTNSSSEDAMNMQEKPSELEIIAKKIEEAENELNENYKSKEPIHSKNENQNETISSPKVVSKPEPKELEIFITKTPEVKEAPKATLNLNSMLEMHSTENDKKTDFRIKEMLLNESTKTTLSVEKMIK